jgi:hypothetical protein
VSGLEPLTGQLDADEAASAHPEAGSSYQGHRRSSGRLPRPGDVGRQGLGPTHRRRAGTSLTAAVGGRSCRPPDSPPPLCQPGDHRPPGRVSLEGRFRRASTSGAVGPDQHSRPPSMPGLLTGCASSATGTKGAPHADRPCNTGQQHRHPDRSAPRPRPRDSGTAIAAPPGVQRSRDS